MNNNRGSNPEMFPLPDATTSLDWKNLLETAKAFEGMKVTVHNSAFVFSNKGKVC